MANGAAVDSTLFAEYLKTSYIDTGRIEDMVLDGLKDPALAKIERETGYFGDGVKIPVSTAANVRVGASFATALATDSNQKGYTFNLTPTQLYSIASFSTPAIQASQTNEQAFFKIIDNEMSRAVKGFNKRLAAYIHRDGTGAVAQLNGTATTNLSTGVLTLANKYDALLFDTGMFIAAAVTHGGALRTGSAKVTGISVADGTITVSTTPTSLITSLTGGDWLFFSRGDANNNTANVVLEGFQSWCVPAAAGSSSVGSLTNSFMSVVRSNDQVHLAGQFYTNSVADGGPGDSYPEALTKAAALVQAVGADDELDLICVNPYDYANLANSGSSKLVQLPATQEGAKLSLGGLALVTDDRTIPIKKSRWTPVGYFEMWSTSTWCLYSSSKPDVVQPDGLTVRWSGVDDTFISYIGYYNVQLGCMAPGWNLIGRF